MGLRKDRRSVPFHALVKGQAKGLLQEDAMNWLNNAKKRAIQCRKL